MSPLPQWTTDSLQSAPLSLKPGSTLVDNLWTLMDNWWTGDGCQPFLISFLFLQYVNVSLIFNDRQYTRVEATTIFHNDELMGEHFAMVHFPCSKHYMMIISFISATYGWAMPGEYFVELNAAKFKFLNQFLIEFSGEKGI